MFFCILFYLIFIIFVLVAIYAPNTLIEEIPTALGKLTSLSEMDLTNTPLKPDYAKAYKVNN